MRKANVQPLGRGLLPLTLSLPRWILAPPPLPLPTGSCGTGLPEPTQPKAPHLLCSSQPRSPPAGVGDAASGEQLGAWETPRGAGAGSCRAGCRQVGARPKSGFLGAVRFISVFHGEVAESLPCADSTGQHRTSGTSRCCFLGSGAFGICSFVSASFPFSCR